MILEACRQNRREGQEKLYKLYYAEMIRVCQRYTDSDDQHTLTILNDAFLKAFKNIQQYNPALGHFTAWLKTIMVNTALSHIRTRKKQIELVHIEQLPEVADNDLMMHKFQLQEVMLHVRSLPSITRLVFNLSVFDGYSHRDIAQELSITENTSRWHLSEARRRLREKMDSPLKMIVNE